MGSSCRASPASTTVQAIVTLLTGSVHGCEGQGARTERTPDAGTSTATDASRIFNAAMGIYLVGAADLEDRYLRADRRCHGAPRFGAAWHTAAVASASARCPLPGGDRGVVDRRPHHPQRAAGVDWAR